MSKRTLTLETKFITTHDGVQIYAQSASASAESLNTALTLTLSDSNVRGEDLTTRAEESEEIQKNNHGHHWGPARTGEEDSDSDSGQQLGVETDTEEEKRPYLERTSKKKKPTLVWVHGFGCGSFVFDKQFGDGRWGDVFMIRYDIRGHGRSSKPLTAASYTSSNFAGDFKAVVDAFGHVEGSGGVYLVGWSFGGTLLADILTHLGPAYLSGVILLSANPYIAMYPAVIHSTAVDIAGKMGAILDGDGECGGPEEGREGKEEGEEEGEKWKRVVRELVESWFAPSSSPSSRPRAESSGGDAYGRGTVHGYGEGDAYDEDEDEDEDADIDRDREDIDLEGEEARRAQVREIQRERDVDAFVECVMQMPHPIRTHLSPRPQDPTALLASSLPFPCLVIEGAKDRVLDPDKLRRLASSGCAWEVKLKLKSESELRLNSGAGEESEGTGGGGGEEGDAQGGGSGRQGADEAEKDEEPEGTCQWPWPAFLETEYVELEQAGHIVFYERPGAVRRVVLGWLERVGAFGRR